jgi:hypothetical protein
MEIKKSIDKPIITVVGTLFQFSIPEGAMRNSWLKMKESIVHFFVETS